MNTLNPNLMEENGTIYDQMKIFSFREVIVCDFGGTITNEDVCDKVMEKFGTSVWGGIGKQYTERVITHEKINESFCILFKRISRIAYIFTKKLL